MDEGGLEGWFLMDVENRLDVWIVCAGVVVEGVDGEWHRAIEMRLLDNGAGRIGCGLLI